MFSITKKIAAFAAFLAVSSGQNVAFGSNSNNDGPSPMDLDSPPITRQAMTNVGAVLPAYQTREAQPNQAYQQGVYQGAFLPRDACRLVAKHAAIEQCLENESLMNLALVCKGWHDLLKSELQVGKSLWKVRQGITTPKREEIYRRFLNGVLLYKPNPGKDDYTNAISFPIRRLLIPLDGIFDLSQCGDAGEFLSIATGYRKGRTDKNNDKVEIWLAPRFQIEKKLESSAAHFLPIMNGWNEDLAPVGMFFTAGDWDRLDWYNHLVDQDLDSISACNFLANWRESASYGGPRPFTPWRGAFNARFHVLFLNQNED
jgi:hypothetical protein